MTDQNKTTQEEKANLLAAEDIIRICNRILLAPRSRPEVKLKAAEICLKEIRLANNSDGQGEANRILDSIVN